MRFLSVCSGIEAASVAWNPLGWHAAAFSEIEPFPCSVLAHHYPTVPNRGDMTKYEEWPDDAIDLLCGGTPCQSFSVAGLRKGLADPRGNLMLTYGAIAARHRPRWLVWENVPGVLSSNGGRDFGSFLGLLGELGYGFAYRVLDAQHFGVPQRRRRVFVVGCLGDWRAAAAVLFERHSLSGHPAPCREAWQEPARCLTRGSGGGQRYDGETETFVTHALTGEGFDASEDGTGRGTPLVPVGADCFNGSLTGDTAATMGTRGSSETASGPTVMIPIDMRQASRGATMTNNRSPGSSGGAPGTGIGEDGDPCPTISTSHTPAIAFDPMPTMTAGPSTEAGHNARSGHCKDAYIAAHGMQVRRLTPRECERLQGFEDDYTLVPHRGKPAADGPRYKALGNSWAVPVVRWIGRRIDEVEQITTQQLEAA